MTKKIFYITSPLYYVNARPHIGHAYTNILCDSFARYRRLLGQKHFFLTGTDEFGTKIEKTASDNGMEPQVYVDSMINEFKELWSLLGIEYDYFIRTTSSEHQETVKAVLLDLEAKGEIYKKSYKGWYCTPCESFWTHLQLLEGKCPDCHREVQELSEENYFFKLSNYQDWLIEYIQNEQDFIQPDIRKNEMLGFLKQPLEDLCITRPKSRLKWGIDFPSSPDHVVYVWFDALINYVSAAKYKKDKSIFKSIWPADVHVVGKDILRQHAIYWPIMLKAMGLELPKKILAHGWWTMSGSKVSKSSGNAVDPIQLISSYGADSLRYYMLNEVTIGSDGAFSEELLAERYRTDLANDLGNLWFRVVSMLGKYFDAKIPNVDLPPDNELLNQAYALFVIVQCEMDAFNPRVSLQAIWAAITRANQYVEENKPWALAKDPEKKEKLSKVLLVLLEAIAHIAVLLQVFLPQTAKRMLERLELKKDWIINDADDFEKPFLKAGTLVNRGEALFPRLEEDEKK